MLDIILDADNFLKWDFTPWDERAFGFKTAEIISFQVSDDDKFIPLIKSLDEWASKESIRFMYTRVGAAEKKLRAQLLQSGFYAAETSFKISKKLPQIPYANIDKRRLFLEKITKDDKRVEIIQSIAENEFHFSRFHDDPFIEERKCRQRYRNWIGDLVNQNIELFLVLCKHKKNVVGFHAQRINEDKKHAELILTGTTGQASMMSVFLWQCALDQLIDRGISSCDTLISAANIGVINLYNHLAFKYEKCLIGYHKWYK